jgi:ubiquinone biosynthesis protein
MAAMGVKPESVGALITRDYIRQMLTDGLFHADPHPGNIIVQKDGGIEWIDLGMVGRLTPTERGLLGKILLGVATRDAQMLKDALLTWGHAGKDVDHGKLLADIDAMVARYSTNGLADLDVSAAVSDLLAVLQKQRIAMPASFTMLSRGLITFEGTIEAISPNLSIMGAVTDYLQRHLLDGFDLRNEFIAGALDAYKVAKKTSALPSQLSNLLDMASKGQIGMSMSVRDLDRPLAKLESTIDRMTLGMIVAGLFIGSSLLCLTAMEPRVLGVPIIGFLGYLGALALSVYIVVKGRP